MSWMILVGLAGVFLLYRGIFFANESAGKWAIAVGAVLLLGCIVWFFGIRQPPKEECGDETMAFVMSQRAVKNQLRSPASAEFPYITDVSSTRTGECTFTVDAYVDSQNGFGAMLRSRYSVKMTYYPDSKTWSASEMAIKQ